jgi:hypothetical protein
MLEATVQVSQRETARLFFIVPLKIHTGSGAPWKDRAADQVHVQPVPR